MKASFYLQNFGCQMNEYDALRLADLLVHQGFSEVKKPEIADLIILNTCAIREKASEKIFSRIGKLRLLKKNRPHLKIAVGGCVAAVEQGNIFRRMPEVDFIFGPATLHLLPGWYEESKKILLEGNPLSKFSHFPKPRTQGPSAFVSIMEGCNNFCSYCIVPFTRGREISRPLSSILEEIEILLKQGVKEVYLLGQNVNAYADPETDLDLARLIHKLASYPEIIRIRFTTSHPRKFTPALIEAFKEPKLVNQLHLPVQSGSNSILQSMRRGYDIETYCQIIEKIRKIRPKLSLSSDFIVGFPGETEEEFEDTLKLVDLLKFDHSFSFIFSKRPNTLAAKLTDNLSLVEKKARLAALQNKLHSFEIKFSEQMLGTTQLVLAERQKNHKNQYNGRTENNRIVNFTGNDEALGQLVKVKITEVLSNSLRGEMVA